MVILCAKEPSTSIHIYWLLGAEYTNASYCIYSELLDFVPRVPWNMHRQYRVTSINAMKQILILMKHVTSYHVIHEHISVLIHLILFVRDDRTVQGVCAQNSSRSREISSNALITWCCHV